MEGLEMKTFEDLIKIFPEESNEDYKLENIDMGNQFKDEQRNIYEKANFSKFRLIGKFGKGGFG